jgi:hypothetical protein
MAQVRAAKSLTMSWCLGCHRDPEVQRDVARSFGGWARRSRSPGLLGARVRRLGLLVESHEGRPTKAAGNPAHPASLGASTAIAQASILSLYEPSRLGSVRHGRSASTWDALSTHMRSGAWNGTEGRGFHLVMSPTSSPTIASQRRRLRARFPEARVHVHASRARFSSSRP